MSSYPFEITDNHKTYKVTFLQSVILKMEYDSSKESYKQFARFFYDAFQLQLIEQQFNVKNTDAIRLRSDNHAYRAKFSRNFIEFIVNGDAYVNYHTSLLPFINKVSEYLERIDGNILNVSIEKINIWPLAKGEIDSPEDFINTVISENLRNSPGLIAGDNAFIEYTDKDLDDSLLIRFGFIPFMKEQNDQPARIVLDTLCNHDNGGLEPSLLPVTTKRLNDILYDAYHWSVTKDVIDIMDL